MPPPATFIRYQLNVLKSPFDPTDPYLTAGLTIRLTDPDPTDPDPTITVTITPTNLTLTTSFSHDFTSTVSGTADTNVTWTATCGTIRGAGTTITFTAPVTPPTPPTCTLTATSSADPTKAADATINVEAVRFTTLSAGHWHSLALDSNGRAWAWGRNDDGQLGDGTTAPRNEPTPVTTPPGVTFAAVSAGGNHSLALDTDGNAWAWGLNGSGQLGDGSSSSRSVPTRVDMPHGVAFASLDGGWAFSLALDADGNAWGWGNNLFGNLGDGTTTSQLQPIAVNAPTGTIFATISTGWAHSVALDTNGNIWSWGANIEGQLGDGTTSHRSQPGVVLTPAGLTFTDISASQGHTLALDADGNAWGWGANYDGQVGDGTSVDRRLQPTIVTMPSGAIFTSITAGGGHSLALDTNGSAWAWGLNGSGQLGDGTTTGQNIPTQVSLARFVTLTEVTAGGSHSLALRNTGNALAWGSNEDGQLGDGTITDRNAPVPVTMP